jgi:hypothetical protein
LSPGGSSASPISSSSLQPALNRMRADEMVSNKKDFLHKNGEEIFFLNK